MNHRLTAHIVTSELAAAIGLEPTARENVILVICSQMGGHQSEKHYRMERR